MSQLIQQPIRLRVFARTLAANIRAKQSLSLSIPVELTGKYDIDSISPREGTRVGRVEIWIPALHDQDDQLAWVELSDLENAHGEELTYVELRRGLLTHWMINLKARQTIESMDRRSGYQSRPYARGPRRTGVMG